MSNNKPTNDSQLRRRELLEKRLRGGSNTGGRGVNQIGKRAGVDTTCPLSFAQERLWFLNQLSIETSLYNVPLAIRLKGTLNTHALEECLRLVV